MRKIKLILFFTAVILSISACTQSEKSSDTAAETKKEAAETEREEAETKAGKARSDKKDKSAESESTESAGESLTENNNQESSSTAQLSTALASTAASRAVAPAAAPAKTEAVYDNYLNDDSIEGPDEYDGGPTYYVCGCEESITLRKSDNTKAAEITQIPVYSSVEFLGKASNGFYKVRYRTLGYTGYVLSAYLDELEPQMVSGQTMTVIKAKESVTLRTAPYTSAKEIMQIPVGTQVYFIEKKRNFYLVVTMEGGYVGYILSDYLRFD